MCKVYTILKTIALAFVFLLLFGADARADVLGDVRVFQTDSSYDAFGAANISATVRAVSQNAYFYVDDRYWSGLSLNQKTTFNAGLEQLAIEFDSTIYPKTTALWGSEPRPGVDGDLRLTVLIEDMVPNSGGYFKTINEYPIAIAPLSNAREMIYVNAASVINGVSREYLTHEFQHLISFNQKELIQGVSDDVWLNEARSEYNVTNAGYSELPNSSLQRRIQAFLRTPSDSLVAWPNNPTDYAVASMFAHYVADRFGADVLAETIRSRFAGAVALNSSLASHGISENFASVFIDWMLASYLNDVQVDDQYRYARPALQNIRVIPQSVSGLSGNSGFVTSLPVQEWQPLWLRFDVYSVQDDAINLKISDPDNVGVWSGAVVANYSDGHYRIFFPDPERSISVPTSDVASTLTSMVLAMTQGSITVLGDRDVRTLQASISVSPGLLNPPVVVATDVSVPTQTTIKDGDLMRRTGQDEIYVVWGKYRRYLTSNILKLYGFQDRPVFSVSDEVFFSYKSSNYIRAIDQERVYAVWPDGTKHWLNITAKQWDDSGRDWNAIFIVNDSEVSSYGTGPDITR